MKFSVYGRFTLEVVREKDGWVAYKVDLGKRVRSTDIALPAELSEAELSTFLDDLFHELSRPGESVKPVA